MTRWKRCISYPHLLAFFACSHVGFGFAWSPVTLMYAEKIGHDLSISNQYHHMNYTLLRLC